MIGMIVSWCISGRGLTVVPSAKFSNFQVPSFDPFRTLTSMGSYLAVPPRCISPPQTDCRKWSFDPHAWIARWWGAGMVPESCAAVKFSSEGPQMMLHKGCWHTRNKEDICTSPCNPHSALPPVVVAEVGVGGWQGGIYVILDIKQVLGI